MSINTAYGRNTLLAFSGFRLANSSTYSPVYTTVILGTARLNFGTRTHFFGHGTPNFCRVNAKLRVRGPKILSGPRPPQEVVSARLKMGPRTKNLLRTRFVSHIAKILCLYKQISRENVHGQTKLYTRAPIYIMVMHKEAIYSTGILATLKLTLSKWHPIFL